MVWVDDQENAKWADAHGLAGKGYPNLVAYDAAGEYVHRIVGFGGMEKWLPDVKTAEENAKALSDARAKAAKDPAALADVAAALVKIADRERDALDAVRQIPAEKRDAGSAKLEQGLVGKIAWLDVEKELNADGQSRSKGVDRKDAAAIGKVREEHAGFALPKVEAWITAHGDAATDVLPAALLKKAHLLGFAGRRDDAVAVAKTIVEKFPGTREAKAAEAIVNPPAPRTPPKK